MRRFNTVFKMDVTPASEDLGGRREVLTLGTNVRFSFEETVIRALGPDVNLSFRREQVGRFEAWMPE